MASVDELYAVFGVDRDVLETIVDKMDTPTKGEVATVLDKAADAGKVPDRDYGEMVDTTEAVEEVPEGVEEEEYMEWVNRGKEGERRAEDKSLRQRTENAAEEGDIPTLVECANEAHEIANDALHSPTRTSLPENVEETSMIATTGISDALDDIAQTGDVSRLREVEDHIIDLTNGDLRKSLLERVNNLHTLIENSGTEYEQARKYVLNEENTPAQVMDRLDEIRQGRYDITLDQLGEIVEDAEEWMQEYRKHARKVEGE